MTDALTILELLERTTPYFAEHGVPSPRLDAELLLGEVLGLRRIDLYLHFEKPVAETDLGRFRQMVRRRANREPLQYILGHADFWGRRFAVSPDVLIPRPETEQLVVRALEWLDAHPQARRIQDVGTGSGCMAITLALERPHLHVMATDCSEAALHQAHQNAEALGAQVAFETAATEPHVEEPIDLIVSNPPYIPSADIDTLQPEVARFEPRLALEGGKDGLAFYRQLLQDAQRLLNADGALVVEIGAEQRAAITEIAETLGGWSHPTCFPDLSGIDRILVFERKD
jgi:release factor glutamine methyltransferase